MNIRGVIFVYKEILRVTWALICVCLTATELAHASTSNDENAGLPRRCYVNTEHHRDRSRSREDTARNNEKWECSKENRGVRDYQIEKRDVKRDERRSVCKEENRGVRNYLRDLDAVRRDEGRSEGKEEAQGSELGDVAVRRIFMDYLSTHAKAAQGVGLFNSSSHYFMQKQEQDFAQKTLRVFVENVVGFMEYLAQEASSKPPYPLYRDLQRQFAKFGFISFIGDKGATHMVHPCGLFIRFSSGFPYNFKFELCKQEYALLLQDRFRKMYATILSQMPECSCEQLAPDAATSELFAAYCKIGKFVYDNQDDRPELYDLVDEILTLSREDQSKILCKIALLYDKDGSLCLVPVPCRSFDVGSFTAIDPIPGRSVEPTARDLTSYRKMVMELSHYSYSKQFSPRIVCR